jgi:hypothetical protein
VFATKFFETVNKQKQLNANSTEVKMMYKITIRIHLISISTGNLKGILPLDL